MTHWPFPQEDWLYNAHLLRCLRAYYRAAIAFRKPAIQWTAEDSDLFVQIVNEFGV